MLITWRNRCEADPSLPTVNSLSQEQFNDRVPDLINVFIKRLANEKPEISPMQIAREHGLHRWRLGYALEELLREFAHLHDGFIDEIGAFGQTNQPDDTKVLLNVHQLASSLIHEAIAGSVTQYNDLQKIGAAERAANLQQTLDDLNELIRRRADVLRMASHDLRGSFGVMRGAAYILDQPGNTEEERTEMLQMLQRNFSKVTSMLTQLMDLARLEAGQESLYIESFDAADLLYRVSETLKPVAEERRLYLRTEGPTTLPVRGDSIKVQRIVQNLLLNSLKYTMQGGVLLHWSTEGPLRWLLTVTDTGPGLSEKSATALTLEPSLEKVSIKGNRSTIKVKTSEPGKEHELPHTAQPKGEGIGLHIVKRLCELLNANMEVEASPSDGTTIRIRFPMRYSV
jgi:signal transduction histidine kinase